MREDIIRCDDLLFNRNFDRFYDSRKKATIKLNNMLFNETDGIEEIINVLCSINNEIKYVINAVLDYLYYDTSDSIYYILEKYYNDKIVFDLTHLDGSIITKNCQKIVCRSIRIILNQFVNDINLNYYFVFTLDDTKCRILLKLNKTSLQMLNKFNLTWNKLYTNDWRCSLFLGTDKKNRTIKLKCRKCNTTREITNNGLINGERKLVCYHCHPELPTYTKLSNEEYTIKFYKNPANTHKNIISTYHGAKDPLVTICHECKQVEVKLADTYLNTPKKSTMCPTCRKLNNSDMPYSVRDEAIKIINKITEKGLLNFYYKFLIFSKDNKSNTLSFIGEYLDYRFTDIELILLVRRLLLLDNEDKIMKIIQVLEKENNQ